MKRIDEELARDMVVYGAAGFAIFIATLVAAGFWIGTMLDILTFTP